MKTLNKSFLKKMVASSVALALPLAMIVNEGQTASGTAEARLAVIRTITISTVDNLEFGELEQGQGAGTTIANTADEAATFNVAGHQSRAINISVDPSVTMIYSGIGADPQGPTNTIPVTLTTNAPASTNLSEGAYTFNVGGSIDNNLDANQVDGSYVGTFSVSVTY